MKRMIGFDYGVEQKERLEGILSSVAAVKKEGPRARNWGRRMRGIYTLREKTKS